MSNEPSNTAEDLIWQNIELGYMEVVGVGDDGQIRYRVTEAGKAHLERLLGDETCTWCKGTGTKLDHVCGWCDGTGIQKPSFHGHEPRTCGEHRTVGPIRAWCYDDREWCYADRDAACRGCGGA